MGFSETLVLDVQHKTGRKVFFKPLERTLEPEYRLDTFGDRPAPKELAMVGGVLPGERLTVDFKAGRYKLIHKLNLKENAVLREKIKKIRATDERNPEQIGSFGSEEEGGIRPEDYATWLGWIDSRIKLGMFTVVSGKMPSLDEIRRMGPIQLAAGVGAGIPGKLADVCCTMPQTAEPAAAK